MTYSKASPPFLRAKVSVASILWTMIIALTPILAAAAYFSGANACRVIFLSILSCLGAEAFAKILFKKPLRLKDGNALLTGLLLAFLLPPNPPWWLPVGGGFFATFIGREIFGGLGQNVFNPPQLACAFLIAAFPSTMASSMLPSSMPIALNFKELLMGGSGGALGDTSKFAILAGGLFLIYRRVIPWKMPFYFLGTVVLISWLCRRDPLFDLLSGSAMLAAFFYITDFAACPTTENGRILFAVLSAAIAMAVRLWSGYAAGETYGILMMNAATPLIDRFVRPRPLG